MSVSIVALLTTMKAAYLRPMLLILFLAIFDCNKVHSFFGLRYTSAKVSLLHSSRTAFLFPRSMTFSHLLYHKRDSISHDDDTRYSCLSSNNRLVNTDIISRRHVFTSFTTKGFPSIIVTSSLITCAYPTLPASAVQGAAEYDLEFYLRDLFQGNKREGNVQASLPPKALPPRNLVNFDVFNVINDSCDGNCVSVNLLSKLTGISTQDISTRTTQLRQKVYTSFQTKNPWKQESVQDEYYFDLTLYCLFRVAAEVMPTDYILRDTWIRNIGRSIYKQAFEEKERMILDKAYIMMENSSSSTVNEIASPSSTNDMPTPISLSQSTPYLLKLLDLFQSTQYISSYRIQKDSPIFDTYDDEDIQQGRSINLLISLIRPVTLGSALQLTAEGSRFSPEFIAPTIAAMWEDVCHLETMYETYFVDNTYRPNPKDFFPDEVLLQLTIKNAIN